MITTYKIQVECENERDEGKYGRVLYYNNYESAVDVFKVTVKRMIDLDIIDPYRIQLWYPGDENKPDGILKSQFVRYPTP